jgi:hypothetical protein
MHSSIALQLSADEILLLTEQVPNEVCNGFCIENFEEQIGCPQSEFKALALALKSDIQPQHCSITKIEAQLFRNALRATLRELGEEEFFTRTGFDFEVGILLLKKLDDFWVAPSSPHLPNLEM